MRTVLKASALWDGSDLIENPLVLIQDGRISSLVPNGSTDAGAQGELIDFGDAILSPAFFDVHIHGGAGHDVMEATPEALESTGRFLASRGTGAYLATTVTAAEDATLRSLEGIAKLIPQRPEEPIAWPVGVHLEGPFLSHAKRGVHPPALLREPDIALFDRMFEAAEGHVRLLTLAPELPGSVELTAHAVSRGVRVSVGHSNADAAGTRAVIDAGATSATHTFNAMRPLDHREPGILGTVLTNESLYAELICDGVHTAPELVRVWWKCKGPERALLVTDAMSAAGMPDGIYQLGGFDVIVADGRAMANGVLAGSVLTLDRALANFVAFTGASVEQGLRLLTANPAAMIGIRETSARLEIGASANLVAVDRRGLLVASFVNGVRVA